MNLRPGPGDRRIAGSEAAGLTSFGWALRKHDDWYQDLVEHSQDVLAVHDLQGRILSINPTPARLTGYTAEEMLQTPLRDLIDPEFRSQFDKYLLEIQRRGESRGLMTVVTRSGERRIWEYRCTLRTQRVPAPVVRCIAHDITEVLLEQKALRTSNEELRNKTQEQERMLQELRLFRVLLDQSSDAIEVLDYETGRYLDANEKACSALGYSREELLALAVFDIDPNVTPESMLKIKQGLRKSASLVRRTVRRRKDGSTFPVEVSLRWVQLDKGYLVVLARDLTERNQAEERLREFERVVESVEEQIVVVNRDYRFVLANRACLAYRNLEREQVVGRLLSEVPHWGFFEAVVKEKLDECFRGKVVTFDLKSTYPTLGERDLSATYVPVEGADGVDSAACIVRDITEQKRSETALRESEARERAKSRELETVLEVVPVAVCIAHDTEGMQITGNRAAYEQMGVPAGSNISRSALEGDRPAFRVLENGIEVPPELLPIQQAACTGRAVCQRPLTILLQDGTRRETVANVVPLFDETGRPRGAVAASMDVTDLKRTEGELLQSEGRFRIALAGSPIKVFNQDRDLRYTWVYNLQEGWSEQDYLGKTDEQIFGAETAAVMTAIKQPVLETGRPTRQEFSLEARGKKYYCDITVEPLRDPKGAITGVNCACVDVTHLREVADELKVAKEKLSEEKLYLEQSIDSELGFGEIIGRSNALKHVMDKVAKVAPSDATVLVMGETGTGKELVARAIHRLSRRKDTSFIKVNCAAIPSGLLESELFGHEKGAFTGAIAKKIGRLELADQGTLFLDEIGEISLELQPKLLRVLQDQEFERLGGTQTLKVNFRLVAASNRDLAESVNRQEFRSDLYYRLNVFPVRTPALRERREDIPLLVEHFVRKCSARMGKVITSIPAKTMEALVQWSWPGNIRELENFVERSVILSPGNVLQVPVSELAATDIPGKSETLRDGERARILRVLRECGGKLGGPMGAAARLGLKRTTLQSKLSKLGIDPVNFRG